jgi:hypothetical protein
VNARARDDARPSVSVVFETRSNGFVRFGRGAPRAGHAGRGGHRVRGRARHQDLLRREEVIANTAAPIGSAEAPRASSCDRSCPRGYRERAELDRVAGDSRRRRKKRSSGEGFRATVTPTRSLPSTRATMDKTTEALLDASVGDFAETGG